MLSRLSLFLLAFFLLSSPALARTVSPEEHLAQAFPAPPVRAAAAVVMDASNGAVLAAVNPHLRLPMASTTKIMTALLALKLGHPTDRITVPKAAFNYEWDATVMGLRPGQVVTLQDLLYGLMLPSGADAANTIAIHYGGSEAHYVAMMNAEAKTLGLNDTHYVNAHGLTAKNHYTSAYDLAVLGQYVSYLPYLMKIAATRSYKWNGHVLTNANHVLFWYSGVDGIKPGYTNDAGICQVLDARRHGRHVVVVLLRTPDLVIDARNLLNFGLGDFTWQQSSLTGDRATMTETGTDRSGAYLYFPATGHYLRGAFRRAFGAAGGVGTLGFPRTEPLIEGKAQVQYFQNGELSMDSRGVVSRLPLGSAAAGANSPRLPPPPLEQPGELDAFASSRTAAARPTPTPTRTSTPRARTTPTPTPVRPTPTPTPTGSPSVSRVFTAFERAHKSMLGPATSQLVHLRGYQVQFFTYSALVYDARTHAVLLLPVGDRLLAARHFLPAYPGNAYPPGFAPASLLKTLGWGQFAGYA